MPAGPALKADRSNLVVVSVYRESAKAATVRTFRFRQHGTLGLPAIVLAFVGFVALLFGTRVHVACSRSADACTWDTFGLDAEHGTVRLSTVGALVVEKDPAESVSRLAFATTRGHQPIGKGYDNVHDPEKEALAAHFAKWLTSGEETFDEAYGPSPTLVAVVAIALLASVLWIVRGGPWVRVTVDSQADVAIVVRRASPLNVPGTFRLRAARMRPWRGEWEIFDEAGTVVPIPASTGDSRARALAAALARD